MIGRFYPLQIEHAGRRWSGQWTLKQGGLICVASAWGSKTAPLGRARPENAATRILTELVAQHMQNAARRRQTKPERAAVSIAPKPRQSRGGGAPKDNL